MVKCLTQGHNTLTVTGLEPTIFIYEPIIDPLHHTRPPLGYVEIRNFSFLSLELEGLRMKLLNCF